MPHPEHEKNRQAWNEMVEVHWKHPDYYVKEFLEGRSSLKRIELEMLGDVHGKHLLHLMCQFGMDTLSWAREGAIVTGVDISDRSIHYAEVLRQKAGLQGDFVRSDVLDLIGVIDKKFDIVFQSHGTLCWLSDLRRWAEVIAHYLKPGGTYLVIDGHPISWLFLQPKVSYFATEPERSFETPDYCDRSYRVRSEQVEWQHKTSDIINALIGAGLVIERFEEYNFSYYPEEEGWVPVDDHYWRPPSGLTDYPLMMSIKATKPA